MSVDGSISGSACKVFIIFVGYVLAIFCFIFFGESKINHKDSIGLFKVLPDQEVIRLDVTMNESLAMDVLDSIKYL